MGVLSLTQVNWWFGVLLEVAVLGLAWWRKLGRQLPFFLGYLCLVVVNEIVLFGIYRIAGYHSTVYFYTYWSFQGLFVTLRAVIVYEVCQSILLPYAGIWRLVNRSLLAIAVGLTFIVTFATQSEPHFFTNVILTGEAGLEMVVVSLLVVGLFFCRYYRVRIDGYLAWIALGLGFYSAVQAANSTFLRHWPDQWLSHVAIWTVLQNSSYDIALILWGIALWRPLPAARPAPVLLSRNEYESLSPLVTARLRELNIRLLEMWK